MELYKELLIALLKQESVRVEFPQLKQNAAELIESVSYQALQKIKEIIADDSLEDKECFMKMEAVLQVFDSMGINTGTRHDFG